MFDLEQQIRSWRTSAADALGEDRELLDELEAHLRDDIERLVRTGQSHQDAWNQASLRVGDPRVLAGEFAKLAKHAWLPAWVANIGLTIFAALVAWLAIARLASGKVSVLLASHVICVAIGYAAVFAIGFLAFWMVIVHAVAGCKVRQNSAFRTAGIRLALAAVMTTASGLALGMWWSRDHLGQWWGWDPREIGALSVLAWSCVLLQCFRSQAPAASSLKLIAIMGNIVVCVSWFGPNLIAGAHLHAYGGVPRAGMGIGAFLFVQFLAIYMSLLPARFLRLERLRFEK